MDPRITMMVQRREHDQRMKALVREAEIRRAFDAQTRPMGGFRSIAAGVRRALRMVDARWAGLDRGRWGDDANPRPGGEGTIAYRSGPAAV